MDYNKYIGLPYKDNGRDASGVDCWGLAYLFYKQELSINLPSYAELYNGAQDKAVSESIELYKDTWDSVKTANIGDLCLFNIYNEPAHVGVYIGDNKFMHAREGQDVVIESLDNFKWSKRFQGFFAYNKNANLVVTTGAPHPFKTQTLQELVLPGTTVEDFVTSIRARYSITTRLATKLVILVDGEVIPKDLWKTTELQSNQIVTYKSIAEGSGSFRTLLTFAIIVAAVSLGVPGAISNAVTGSATSAVGLAIGTAAVNMGAMILVNAIAPIRMPNNPNMGDPGQAKSLNLFSGASNQANRFGPIPVVLGKVRVTGLLGATPYVDTLTDTSILNLIIVWGFGPLSVTDIQVGTNPIESYFNKPGDSPEFIQDIPLPVTLSGTANDDFTSFNKLYSGAIEQQQINLELVNNTVDGNPWQSTVLKQTNSNAIDVAFTFPEGMRQLVVSGNDAGTINQADAYIEVQIRKYNTATNTWPDWVAKPTFTLGDYTKSSGYTEGYSDSLVPSGFTTVVQGDYLNEYSKIFTPLYQWYVYALSNSGGIQRFDGAATKGMYIEPDAELLALYKAKSYSNLLGNDDNLATYTRMPVIPSSGYLPLYAVCIYGASLATTINYLSTYSGYGGLTFTASQLTTTSYDDNGSASENSGVKVSIAEGYVAGLTPTTDIGVPQAIFNTTQMIGTVTGVTEANGAGWSELLNSYGIWSGTSSTFDKSTQVTFPVTGFYNIEASCDDNGYMYIDGKLVFYIPTYTSTVSTMQYVKAGTRTVRITGANSGGGAAGIACKITYTPNGFLNSTTTTNTILPFGTPGFYYKYKDGFNFVYRIKNLPEGQYEVRTKRLNSDVAEPTTDVHNYHKAAVLSITGYANALDSTGNVQLPINTIPNTYLAKTAINIQSTSKVNGSIDGINAVVQTICYDWNKTSRTWVVRATSNPASLFLYVLTHPGNAYRLSKTNFFDYVNRLDLQTWHEFCDTNGFEFNSVITSTQSVMDVLRDIAAAGKASPTFIDGKWGVIVDKARTYVTQHFTPHNSWGFESTKVLPRLPDAFRVTFANRDKAYQTDELIVFNYGKTLATAEIFEEISLPGVTNAAQAAHLARWHLAQLKLRPETYTINTDFEYLVCTRGDLVRVSHDVPLWGTGTGRLKAIGTNTLELTEPVYLTAGKSYQIRIRINSPAVTSAENSTVKALVPITVSNWYSTITLTTNIVTADKIEVDNLYMLGELLKESQQLIVLSIEPTTNTSAKIILTDYSPEIYSINMNSATDSQLPIYNPNITVKSNQAVLNTISQAPVISSAISDSLKSEEISKGVYQNVLTLSFGNISATVDQAQKIQTQVVLGDTEFSDSLIGAYTIDKSAGILAITGLKTLTIYKIRARYTNATGSISGPWSDTLYTTSNGKTDNLYSVTDITLDLEGKYIVAVPTLISNVPNDVKTYEYRLYKNSGTGDFWDLDTTANNILVSQSLSQGRFNLLDIPAPRISTTGVTYRVACRPVDNNNNYGASSALSTIVVKTIQ